MIDRRFNFDYGLLAIALAVILVLAAVVAAGAIALRVTRSPQNLLRVPGDYPTIQAAITAASPGDIIQVAPGVYNENITLDKGVTLVAERFDQLNPLNNATVIDGAGGAAVIMIPASLPQMPVIRGFTIRNGGDGIQAHSPFIAEYNYLTGSGNLVNYQEGGGGANRGNIYFKPLGDAIHVDNLDRPIVIENNRILYAAEDGIEVNLQNASVPPTVTEVSIWNNMIIGSREDGIQFTDFPGDPQDTNRRFVVAGNLIANNHKAGLGITANGNALEDYSGADTAEAIRVFNDTFYGNEVGISGGDNLVAFNNIITNSSARGARRVQGQPGSNSVIAYTLFFANGIDSEETVLGPGIITGQDPLFVAVPGPGPDGIWETVDDDFSGLLLQPGSPAIDRGVTQYLAASGEAVPPTPISGFTGAAPDLGWREYGSPIFAPPTATLAMTLTLAPTVTPPVFTPTATLTQVPPTGTLPPATATNTFVPPTIANTLPPVTPTAGTTATATPGLTLTTIVPNNATAGTTVNLTLSGTGFTNGAVVVFEGGQGTASEVATVQVINPTTIVIAVNVKADASFGIQAWDVRVTLPNGATVVAPDAFTAVPEGGG